ncbi:ComEA family DNA-binding protein [Microbulbifer agarilyticus]|uniref:ComEA family DNA-binding protein n=1 Tax=Microbulbifer agarilyticus TaxID=260552 RepID=UPI001CD51D59|nr:helix-hairpin-helix domain-containing protein [Microbulbifer agarilyticus]MCA0892197.1 helix-hairpin-helix domain-containing protein [Microbulbifer agarilyticus]
MKLFRIPAAVLIAITLTLSALPSFAAEEAVVKEVKMVSLNTATAEELADALDGVGVTRAELIIQYREENGSFSSVEELLEIKGIGVATLEKNKDRIQL